MAYPKYSSSLALIALVLIAMASLMPNCQATILPVLNPNTLTGTASVVGVVNCAINAPGPAPQPPLAANVTLSCDGGRTPLVPAVPTNAAGVYVINLFGLQATLVDPTRCAVYLLTPVAGCGPIPIGNVARAPITLITPLLSPIFVFLRLFIGLRFTVVPIA